MKRLSESEQIEKKRDEVLSRGKKFKYPLQFARHRVVIDTVVISFISIALLVFFGWLTLYKFQSTADIIYRLTQILPLNVATIDGAPVRYSDYLMLYKSSEKTFKSQATEDDDLTAISNAYKRSSLTLAEDYAYAQKIAGENNITVTEEEIDSLFHAHQTVGGVERSKEAFLKVLETSFHMTESEYRRLLKLMLTRAKVAEFLDENARSLANSVAKKLQENGGDFKDVRIDGVTYEETGGLIDKENIDGGRATMALSLDEGTYSERFISSSGDAYYFVKLLNKTETEVSYASLKIPFTTYDKTLASIREAGNVSEFIEFPAATPQDETSDSQPEPEPNLNQGASQ